MKASTLLLALPAVVSAYTAEEYANGDVHQKLMSLKNAQWDLEDAQGLRDPSQWVSWLKLPGHGPPGKDKEGVVRCKRGLAVAEEGNANQTFRCDNMDLYDFMSHADLGSIGQGSSSWGWVDPKSRREFGAIGQFDGTAFVEITKKGQMQYLGRLPNQDPIGSRWREIRIDEQGYCIIGSEAVAHGVQIFDMKKLLKVDPKRPQRFSTLTDLTGLYNKLPIGRTHNIVLGATSDYAIAVGAQPRNDSCQAGLIFLDLSDPSNPTSPGCASQDGYVHDAQCVKYNGPDKRYLGQDICFGYNENSVTVYAVNDKRGNPAAKLISNTTYPGARYTHQGAFIRPNWHQYVILDDELDEQEKTGPPSVQAGFPATYIMDFSDLEKPKYTGYFNATGGYGGSPIASIDHNQYVWGDDGRVTQSNYGAGIWVHDVSSIPRHPDGSKVKPVGFFDIYPEDDAQPNGGLVAFHGTWSHYKFRSGYMLVNTIERGVFIVKLSR